MALGRSVPCLASRIVGFVTPGLSHGQEILTSRCMTKAGLKALPATAYSVGSSSPAPRQMRGTPVLPGAPEPEPNRLITRLSKIGQRLASTRSKALAPPRNRQVATPPGYRRNITSPSNQDAVRGGRRQPAIHKILGSSPSLTTICCGSAGPLPLTRNSTDRCMEACFPEGQLTRNRSGRPNCAVL